MWTVLTVGFLIGWAVFAIYLTIQTVCWGRFIVHMMRKQRKRDLSMSELSQRAEHAESEEEFMAIVDRLIYLNEGTKA